jgi:glyoxylase-like metal-dependent hydrolase (beta-lactamase superfamily II)
VPVTQALQRISDRVFWLPPSPPDRPSLCAVAGERRTLMLDAGSSEAHARLFLDGLVDEGVAPPSSVALTHSHWDHVFGAAALDAQVIAHTLTAEALDELAATDWSDEALDHRVAAGRVSPEHAANVKKELPAPREVRVAPVDIVLQDGLDIELGDVTVRVRHVGGDHAADSCVMFVEPDRVLFLGDCLYDSPDGRLTSALSLPLLNAVLDFGAEQYVEGHSETVISPAELERLAAKVRLAERLVSGLAPEGRSTAEAAVLSRVREESGEEPDEDMVFVVRAFIAGYGD